MIRVVEKTEGNHLKGRIGSRDIITLLASHREDLAQKILLSRGWRPPIVSAILRLRNYEARKFEVLLRFLAVSFGRKRLASKYRLSEKAIYDDRIVVLWVKFFEQIASDQTWLPGAGLQLVLAEEIRLNELLDLLRNLQPSKKLPVCTKSETDILLKFLANIVNKKEFLKACRLFRRIQFQDSYLLLSGILQLTLQRQGDVFIETLYEITKWKTLSSRRLNVLMREEYVGVIRDQYSLPRWGSPLFLFTFLRFLYCKLGIAQLRESDDMEGTSSLGVYAWNTSMNIPQKIIKHAFELLRATWRGTLSLEGRRL